MGCVMSQKPTTAQRIQDFLLVDSPQRSLPKQYEIYIGLDDNIWGSNIEHLSEKKIIEGYDKVWRLHRGDTKLIIASNINEVTVEHAKWFAIAIHHGNIKTITVDLSFLNDDTK